MVTESVQRLCSNTECRSFLVPSYGFENLIDAMSYWKGPMFPPKDSRIFSARDAFEPVSMAGKAYVPRMSATYGRWLASELVGVSRIGNGKPIWEMLRSRDEPRPANSYNVALLVDGRRQFSRIRQQTTKFPKWWYRISDGDKDCFAVWGRQDGREFGGAATDDGTAHLYTARSGRGVIYSCETVFDRAGNPTDLRTELVRIEFSILDRDPMKDDMLRVCVSQQFDSSFDGHLRFMSGTLDELWITLMKRAHAGFERSCVTVRPETEAWRKHFIEQREKFESDRLKYADSFAERTEDMDWQEALRLVTEPWQLQCVISAHASNPQFYDSPGYPGTRSTNVSNMLAAHDCTEERREALWKMVADYVEPCDNLWNYTGD
jgi:hypothetical protein